MNAWIFITIAQVAEHISEGTVANKLQSNKTCYFKLTKYLIFTKFAGSFDVSMSNFEIVKVYLCLEKMFSMNIQNV